MSASGFSGYLSVDIKTFRESNTDTASFTENKVVFSSGGHDLPEPVGLQLIPIHDAVKDSFFRALDQRYRCQSLAQRRSNVKKILREYPRVKGVSKPQGTHSYLFKNTWNTKQKTARMAFLPLMPTVVYRTKNEMITIDIFRS